jgi:hypothetical protein
LPGIRAEKPPTFEVYGASTVAALLGVAATKLEVISKGRIETANTKNLFIEVFILNI